MNHDMKFGFLNARLAGPAGSGCMNEGDLCPPTYRFPLAYPSQGQGGGVALLFKS